MLSVRQLLMVVGVQVISHAARAAAQDVSPMCSNCGSIVVYAVPDPVTKPPNAGPFTATFVVRNTFASGLTVTPVCQVGTGLTCGTVTPSSVYLGPGAHDSVRVQYTTGASPTTLTLQAWHDDEMIPQNPYTGTQTVLSPVAPSMALRNRPDQLERGLCLTAGAGDAAWQCGDLLVAHGMPGYRTLGRDRSLTLVYNSATAAPRPTVAVAVTQPAWVLPDSVQAELWVGSIGGSQTLRASARYATWGGQGIPVTRQIVLGFDASALGTGIYDYTLAVRNRFAGVLKSDSVSGKMVVVNRSASRYGGGWELAGVEWIQLFGSGNAFMIWVGGDGSARIYTRVGAETKWVAPLGAFRDTVALDSGVYKRKLRHGVQVHYNTAGRHIKTVNRVGQATLFGWGAGDSLVSITLPPSGTGGSYAVNYTGGKVSSLVDPGGRVLGLTVTSSKLVALTDPDAVSTAMTYDGSGRMLTRANRLGYSTTYEYTGGLRVTRASVPYGPTGDSTAVTNYTPWDHSGVCIGTCAGPLATADTFFVRTKLDGPRADVADTVAFYVDRWGAPTRTVNAIGVTTRIRRQSAVYPQLVTEVLYPNNRIVRMTYDTTVGRGNLKMVRDSTSHLSNGLPTKATTYTYGSGVALDSPTQVADALGRTTTYTYNGMGILDSTIDTRGHVTKFLYDSTPGSPTRGVIRSITERSVQTWVEGSGNADDSSTAYSVLDHVTRLGYDGKGNVDSVAAPHGVVTSYENDSYGRTFRAWDGLNMRTELEFDLLNRVLRQRQDTAATSSPFGLTIGTMACESTQVLCADSSRGFTPALAAVPVTEFRHNNVGLDTLIGPLGASRKFGYDARAMPRKQIDELGRQDSLEFNATGQAIRTVSRRGDQVFHSYDALGRLSQTRYGPFTYPTVVTVPGDTAIFVYDSLNNLLTATNRRGQITRTYYADGSLRSKISSRPSGGAADTLRYSYNAAGQRTLLVRGPDSISYLYDGTSGDLLKLRVKWGAPVNRVDSVMFTWDGLGRRFAVTLPRNVQVTYRYDKLGILRRVKSTHSWSPTGPSSNLKFSYAVDSVDPGGRLLHQRVLCDSVWTDRAYRACENAPSSVLNRTMRYTRLGWLASSHMGFDFSRFGYDAAGNMIRRWKPGVADTLHIYTHQAGTNRLIRDSSALSLAVFVHDSNGARTSGGHYDPGLPYLFQTKFHYDALGRTNGLSFSDVNNGGALTTQGDVCQYDADGHMVKPCEDWSPFLGYDGSNVTSAYGWIPGPGWTFVHGPGTDDPLLGLHRWDGNTRLLVWVTDGNGRQFAVSDTTGGDPALQGLDFDGASGYRGWQWAGPTRRSYGFSASRTGPSNVPTLSVFRNRLYDQATGRWVQEDPIGIAGGINLYQFNGNNPSMYSDPFGLTECDDRRASIRTRIASLQRRIAQYLAAYARGEADAVHLNTNIAEERAGLEKEVQRYYQKKCKDDDDHDDFKPMIAQARQLVAIELPEPQLPHNPAKGSSRWSNDLTRDEINRVGASVVGTLMILTMLVFAPMGL